MKYNLSTQARLQAQKDICEELAKEGKTYIDVSLTVLLAFQDSLQRLNFYYSSRCSWQLERGKNGIYTNSRKQLKRWQIR